MAMLRVCARCRADGSVLIGRRLRRCPDCGGDGIYSPVRSYQAARQCRGCGRTFNPTGSDRRVPFCTFCEPRPAGPGQAACPRCARFVRRTPGPGRPRIVCWRCRPPVFRSYTRAHDQAKDHRQVGAPR